jgi:hypothetical protein
MRGELLRRVVRIEVAVVVLFSLGATASAPAEAGCDCVLLSASLEAMS